MTTANPSPLDVALIVQRRQRRIMEEDLTWAQLHLDTPRPLLRIKRAKKPKRKLRRRFLTKHEHMLLASGELPKGVHWGQIRLTRRQKGMRKKARSIYARRIEKSFSDALAG